MIKKIVISLFIFIIALFAYSLITRTMEAVKSGERLSQSADSVFKLEAENKLLKKRLGEVQREDFIEEEVRNKLGFVKKGEVVVVIPEEKIKLVLGATSEALPRLSNWLGWIKLFWR